MTATDSTAGPPPLSQNLFAVTVFASAALVFLVQPMIARLALPLLGGSPSVWNTSMVFFQAALLLGYGYAHALQRIRSLKRQAVIHCLVLVAAVVVLPLRVSELVGPPSSNHPNLWLLAMLTASVGAPFAALSATAPLVQAWYARTTYAQAGAEPYVLYAASNLGSLLALVAYPLVVEPTTTLRGQSLGWSIGYGGFVLLMAALALTTLKAARAGDQWGKHGARTARATWSERIQWMFLAAVPSSLMLGVTTHLTTDVASAPFLWVLPLALYLVTFIIAFQTRPAISPEMTLILQAAALLLCAAFIPFKVVNFLLQVVIHLAAFFLTALMCHQGLMARRPPPERLTEFYLWMSVGGVVGGAFTALVAPVVFTNVWEYPLVLALACLARPTWRGGTAEVWRWGLFILGVFAALGVPVIDAFAYRTPILAEETHRQAAVIVFLGATMICAFLIRRHRMMFLGTTTLLLIVAHMTGDRVNVRESWRSFFGVVRQSESPSPKLGGTVRALSHGTTLHGAQALDPAWRCRPLLYYAPETPIGQVFMESRRRKPALNIGAVGLGTGSVAAYVRPQDRLVFFEIDPQVIAIATDPKHFTYTTECAKGQIGYELGDARLTLAKQPKGVFDILLIDAFSSDSVPAHLMTVEAVRGYLTHLKPDGVLILHLSNRNLELSGPAMAVAKAAGGTALLQMHRPAPDSPAYWESAEDALIVARTPQALAAYAADPRWTPSNPNLARPWTDDYTNLVGSLYARMKTRWDWLP